MAEANFGFMSTQVALDQSVLDPTIHGMYETGIDNNWCAFPVYHTADDNPSYDRAQRGGEMCGSRKPQDGGESGTPGDSL